jgi:hypothetical protein
MKILFLLFYIIFFSKIYVNAHSFCGSHLLPKKAQKRLIANSTANSNKTKSNKDKRKLSTEDIPINIIVDDSYILYQLRNGVVSIAKYDLISNSLTTAVQMLTKLISVEPNTDEIELNKAQIIDDCDLEEFCYNDAYLSPNKIPRNSIVIYPRFHDFNQSGQNNILSSASFCAIDAEGDKRPTAGFIYIEQNITDLELRKKNIDKYYTMILLHELTHILVFDKLLLNPNIFKEIEILTQNRTIITSTRVVEMAKRHFGCPSLKGIELENQEYSWKDDDDDEEETNEVYLDIYQNHWDARIMLTDYMTSINYDESVISEITLALFEDSGWYTVKYITGGLFRYGKNQGCSFINSHCVYGGISFFKNEYCIKEKTTMCTPGRTHRAMCGLTSYPAELEIYYRYFTNSKKGGHLAEVDYCPIAKTNSSISKTYYSQGHCAYGEVELYPESLGYKMGSESICLLSSLTPKNNDETLKDYPSSFRALCYQVECSNIGGEKSIIIHIGNNAVICPASGGTQTIDGYYGYILCPDYNLICTGSEWCTDPITCIQKNSFVNEDSFIYDYQSSTSQDYQDLLNYKVPTQDKITIFAQYINRINYFIYFIFFSLIMISL